MRRILSLFVMFFCIQVALQAQKKITFMPQWTPQSQFAGYYVALEKGFYKEEGLDVEIRHIGVNSTESIMEQLLKGKVDIAGQQLMQAMISRADGNPVLNVMQLNQVSGLWCVSHKPISDPKELDGCRVGKWKVGYSEICDIMQAANNIAVDWIPFINGISLYVYGAVDATLCYSYSEYIAMCLAIGHIPDEQVLKFSDFGYDCPEDGLYVTEKYYSRNKDAVDAFVRATKKGWDYVREHKAEAVELAMKYVKNANVITNRAHQSMMLDECLRLQINPATGAPDYAPVSDTTFRNISDALFNTGCITRPLEYNELIRK